MVLCRSVLCVVRLLTLDNCYGVTFWKPSHSFFFSLSEEEHHQRQKGKREKEWKTFSTKIRRNKNENSIKLFDWVEKREEISWDDDNVEKRRQDENGNKGRGEEKRKKNGFSIRDHHLLFPPEFLMFSHPFLRLSFSLLLLLFLLFEWINRIYRFLSFDFPDMIIIYDAVRCEEEVQDSRFQEVNGSLIQHLALDIFFWSLFWFGYHYHRVWSSLKY